MPKSSHNSFYDPWGKEGWIWHPCPGNDVPDKDALGDHAPGKDAPGNYDPGNDAPGNDACGDVSFDNFFLFLEVG